MYPARYGAVKRAAALASGGGQRPARRPAATPAGERELVPLGELLQRRPPSCARGPRRRRRAARRSRSVGLSARRRILAAISSALGSQSSPLRPSSIRSAGPPARTATTGYAAGLRLDDDLAVGVGARGEGEDVGVGVGAGEVVPVQPAEEVGGVAEPLAQVAPARARRRRATSREPVVAGVRDQERVGEQVDPLLAGLPAGVENADPTVGAGRAAAPQVGAEARGVDPAHPAGDPGGRHAQASRAKRRRTCSARGRSRNPGRRGSSPCSSWPPAISLPLRIRA